MSKDLTAGPVDQGANMDKAPSHGNLGIFHAQELVRRFIGAKYTVGQTEGVQFHFGLHF
jgi:hypothetical protein